MDNKTKITAWFTETRKEDSKKLIDSVISMVDHIMNEYYGPWRYDFYLDELFGKPEEKDFIKFFDFDEETGESYLPEEIKKYIDNPVTNIQAMNGDVNEVMSLHACHSCRNVSLENIEYHEFLHFEIIYEIGEFMYEYSDELEKLFDMTIDDIFCECLDYTVYYDVIIPEIKKKYNNLNMF